MCSDMSRACAACVLWLSSALGGRAQRAHVARARRLSHVCTCRVALHAATPARGQSSVRERQPRECGNVPEASSGTMSPSVAAVDAGGSTPDLKSTTLRDSRGTRPCFPLGSDNTTSSTGRARRWWVAVEARTRSNPTGMSGILKCGFACSAHPRFTIASACLPLVNPSNCEVSASVFNFKARNMGWAVISNNFGMVLAGEFFDDAGEGLGHCWFRAQNALHLQCPSLHCNAKRAMVPKCDGPLDLVVRRLNRPLGPDTSRIHAEGHR